MIVLVNNPSLFKSSLEEDGWIPKSGGRYRWKYGSANNPPRTCEGMCPVEDADGNGGYALVNGADQEGNWDNSQLNSPWIASVGPQCRMEFFYQAYSTNYASGHLEVFINQPNATSTRRMLWSQLAGPREWKMVDLFIGQQKMPFYIEIQGTPASSYYLPAFGAVDDIRFYECETPEPTEGCDPTEDFICQSGACANYVTQVCDFADHCGDSQNGHPSSDENDILCQSYTARCSFDDPARECYDWQAGGGDLVWKVSQASNVPHSGYPGIDHTLGTSEGHLMHMPFDWYSENKLARYATALRYQLTRDTERCALRFYLYIHGDITSSYYNPGSISIAVRTSYSPMIENVLATYSYPIGGGNWVGVNYELNPGIDVPLNTPFEWIIQGKAGNMYYSAGVAIDDISLTPECHSTTQLLPGQSQTSTTTHAPACDSVPGHYQCADKTGCYSISQHCNFMADCQDGSDEIGCTFDYCDFDDDNSTTGNSTFYCNWRNVCSGDSGSNPECVQWLWTWFSGPNVPQNLAAPPQDYTSNGTGGGFMMSSGGHSINDRAIFQSTQFQDASPDCTLNFAYYAYVYPSWETPSFLNVQIKSKQGRKLALKITADDVNQWRTASVNIYTPDRMSLF